MRFCRGLREPRHFKELTSQFFKGMPGVSAPKVQLHRTVAASRTLLPDDPLGKANAI